MSIHVNYVKNAVIATRLINEYISTQGSGALGYVRQLFDQVSRKDTILWSSIISAYTRYGRSPDALQLYSQMLYESYEPNHFIYATVARACSGNYLKLGENLHSRVVKTGFMVYYVVVETALLDMYAKCGVLDSARKIFYEMENRNMVTWNAMIACHLHNKEEANGLSLFYQLKCREYFAPDEFTVATALACCAATGYSSLGMQVHGYLIVGGFESHCTSSLINMYFKCGNVRCAERAADGVGDHAVLKLIMIRGYVFNHRYHEAIKYIARTNGMIEVFKMDHTAIVPVLTACTKLSLLKAARQLHGILISLVNFYDCCHFTGDHEIIGSALVYMYCKCGSVSDAHNVFENCNLAQHVSCWNTMITGHISNGFIEEARSLWENMPTRNVISWTCIISGYVHNGMPQEALGLLTKMYTNEDTLRVEGNCLTFVAGLEACSQLTDSERGRQIHAKILRVMPHADSNNVIVGAALVDMYVKASYLNYAQSAFDRILKKNVVVWTSIISGYAFNGCGTVVLDMFQKMVETGIEPNEVTFVSILTACSHCGLVDEGLLLVKIMKEKYKVMLKEDHYTCLIDMLGRAGRLTDALNLLKEIEEKEIISEDSSGTLWAALLGACQSHGDVEVGTIVAGKMQDKKHQVSATSISLSNIYAAHGMFNEAYEARECQRRVGYADRKPGLSQISAS